MRQYMVWNLRFYRFLLFPGLCRLGIQRPAKFINFDIYVLSKFLARQGCRSAHCSIKTLSLTRLPSKRNRAEIPPWERETCSDNSDHFAGSFDQLDGDALLSQCITFSSILSKFLSLFLGLRACCTQSSFSHCDRLRDSLPPFPGKRWALVHRPKGGMQTWLERGTLLSHRLLHQREDGARLTP